MFGYSNRMVRLIKNELNDIFILILFISFLTLPFFRWKIHSYYVPVPVIVGVLYIIKNFFLNFNLSMQKLIENFYKKHKILFFVFILFVSQTMLSILVSKYPNWRNFLKLLFFVMFTSFLIAFLKSTSKNLQKFLLIFYIINIFLCLLGLYNFFSGKTSWFQFTFLYQKIIRGEHLIGSRNVDIYLILSGFVIGVAYFFLTQYKLLFWLSFMPYIFSVLLSFSRGGLISMIFLFSLGTVLINRKKKKVIMYIIYFLITIGFCFFITHIQYVGNHIVKRWKNIKNSPRWDLLIESLNFMLSHPLFGIGLSNYKFYTHLYLVYHQKKYPISTAHNSFLNFGAETGIFGFFLITLLIFYPMYKYFSFYLHLKSKIEELPLEWKCIYFVGILWSCYLIIINFFNIFYLDSGYIFWTVYAFCISIINLIKLEYSTKK